MNISVSVAKRVAEKQKFTFMKTTVFVQLKTPLQSSVHGGSFKTKSEQSEGEAEYKLEVTGIPDSTPKEYLTLFFESKKNNGGPVENVDFDPDTGTAIISFKDKESKLNVFLFVVE